MVYVHIIHIRMLQCIRCLHLCYPSGDPCTIFQLAAHIWSIVFVFHWDSTSLGATSKLNIEYGITDALSMWHKYNVIAYIVVIHGRLNTRVETRCPGGFSISCLASRSRYFSNSEIEFYFHVLVKFSSNHAKKFLQVYLNINLLFQVITSLWGRSALDNLSEFELVTIVIIGYMLRYHTGEFG